jgi:hypothetical protein
MEINVWSKCWLEGSIDFRQTKTCVGIMRVVDTTSFLLTTIMIICLIKNNYPFLTPISRGICILIFWSSLHHVKNTTTAQDIYRKEFFWKISTNHFNFNDSGLSRNIFTSKVQYGWLEISALRIIRIRRRGYKTFIWRQV